MSLAWIRTHGRERVPASRSDDPGEVRAVLGSITTVSTPDMRYISSVSRRKPAPP